MYHVGKKHYTEHTKQNNSTVVKDIQHCNSSRSSNFCQFSKIHKLCLSHLNHTVDHTKRICEMPICRDHLSNVHVCNLGSWKHIQ